MARMGRPPKISPEHREVLVRLTRDKPTCSLRELQAALERETGVRAHEVTISRSLREAGVRRGKAGPQLRVQASTSAKKRYGYTEAHRRHDPEQTYPSCLTDAEWALVEDIFDNEGGQGMPARYPRRLLVDACCYVVRTGGSWRMLPKGFPQWENVYRTFRRWSVQGKFEAMHDRLRAQWREREGRKEEPTAMVLDAQSTRSSPPGRRAWV
jgi:transposase